MIIYQYSGGSRGLAAAWAGDRDEGRHDWSTASEWTSHLDKETRF